MSDQIKTVEYGTTTVYAEAFTAELNRLVADGMDRTCARAMAKFEAYQAAHRAEQCQKCDEGCGCEFQSGQGCEHYGCFGDIGNPDRQANTCPGAAKYLEYDARHPFPLVIT